MCLIYIKHQMAALGEWIMKHFVYNFSHFCPSNLQWLPIVYPAGFLQSPTCLPFKALHNQTLITLLPELNALAKLVSFFAFLFSFFFFSFLGPHPRRMDVSSLGVELELQLLAYTTATAIPDLSFYLQPIPQLSSWQMLDI